MTDGGVTTLVTYDLPIGMPLVGLLKGLTLFVPVLYSKVVGEISAPETIQNEECFLSEFAAYR